MYQEAGACILLPGPGAGRGILGKEQLHQNATFSFECAGVLGSILTPGLSQPPFTAGSYGSKQ